MVTPGFTDGKRWVVTEDDCRGPWCGGKNGSRFKCSMCGHKFVPGDGARFQYNCSRKFTTSAGKTYGVYNIVVCDACDGPDVLDRWVALNAEFMSDKFWQLRD